jgi:hypothetical protein
MQPHLFGRRESVDRQDTWSKKIMQGQNRGYLSAARNWWMGEQLKIQS